MKIRHKITFWITAAGLVVSIVFSLVIYFEMNELSFDAVDAELKALGSALAATFAESGSLSRSVRKEPLLFAEKHYWIALYDDADRAVYESPWTHDVHLPQGAAGAVYTVTRNVPKNLLNFHQGGDNEVTFRVCVVSFSEKGRSYLLQIAKPVERMDEELVELVKGIAVGMAAATLVLIALSAFLAGRIVRPIAVINRLSREITEFPWGAAKMSSTRFRNRSIKCSTVCSFPSRSSRSLSPTRRMS